MDLLLDLTSHGESGALKWKRREYGVVTVSVEMELGREASHAAAELPGVPEGVPELKLS